MAEQPQRACSGPPEPDSQAYADGPGGQRRGLGVRVEIVTVAGREGDELDARQNAAILEILRWLHRRRGT